MRATRSGQATAKSSCRPIDSYFGVSEDPTRQRLYAYDASGNRLSVGDEGATFYYSYDATDALIKKGTDPYGLGADSFVYDELGQLQTSRPSDPDSPDIDTTAYSYDPAGHLVCISTSGDCGSADTARTTFVIDALGRQAARTGTADPLIYAYLGTSAQVSSTATDGSSITLSAYSAIDAIGNRISTGTPDALGYLIGDLHGNVAASISNGSSPSYLSAYRYDPYGQTLDTYSAGSGAVPVPFRYQGRILQSADGATDLYDFGARSYDPGLGVFTSFDSVSGSAQNPLTLNRYLYAEANPSTFIDPTGHCVHCQIMDKDGAPDYAGAVVSYAEKTGDYETAVRLLKAPNCQPCRGVGDCAADFTISLVVTVASAPYFPLLCAFDPGGCAKDVTNMPQTTLEASQACLGGDAGACGGLVGAAITLRGVIKGIVGKVKPTLTEPKVPLGETPLGEKPLTDTGIELSGAGRPVDIAPKIAGQMPGRGWTMDLIEETYLRPAETHPVWDYTTGVREPATAYVRPDGSYVVVNSNTRAVVQISDRGDPGWKPVWDDPRFQR